MTRTEQVAALLKSGMTLEQARIHLGTTESAVRNARNRARDKGLLPPHRKKDGFAAFKARMQNHGQRIVSVKDVISALTVEQSVWLANEGLDIGCYNIAESIAELVRDAHAEATS